MNTKDKIITQAKTYLGTPYAHQGRLKGIGIDCIGLIICVLKDLSLIPPDLDFSNYDRTPDGELLKNLLDEYCNPTPTPEPGDLILFRICSNPQHVGLLMEENKFIHAYQGGEIVSSSELVEWWKKRIIGFYQLPGH